ncbi:MAG TPA: methyltransferase [Streptosporangiaceae bacterium]|jgi:uncharacterized glyoxalase superfamily protein PhnB/SAM-dependent methyltransferase
MTNSPTLRPRLVVADAVKAIDYYAMAFGAEVIDRYAAPDGKIVHCELAVGEARFTLKDEDAADRAPAAAGGSGALLMLEVEDVDAVAARMVAAGGTVVFPVADADYGRSGRVADPFGHAWLLHQRSAPDIDLYRLTDLQTPWCVHVAATLRIADHIAAGVTDIDGLAAVVGADRTALHNVLVHLVNKGVFTQTGPGRFGLNLAAADGLRDPFLDLDGIGGRMAHAWSTLLTYVRTGKPGYHELFGRPWWEDLAANPEIGAEFDALMGPAGHGTPNPDIELGDGWAGVQTVVDVGGGTGALLAEILRARPGLRGTLVDLPATVARATETFEAAEVGDRVTRRGQSFFDPLPAGADVYLLKSVLNDWPEEETLAILRRCAEAARPGGRIVIMGGVAPDETPPALSIEMVLVGGTTSSITEFRELARRAGLEVVAAGRQAAGRYVVECRTT